MKHWLLITDLDGTLLDGTYPQREAALAIDSVARAYPEVSVVLASSKTLREMVRIGALCDSDPFLLFENGVGCAWRESRLCGSGDQQLAGFEVRCSGIGYTDLRAQLEDLRTRGGYRFRGFADMTSSEVAERTGLDLASAEAARDRLASEPICWEDDKAALGRFAEELAAAGLRLDRGGRFHIVTSGHGKQKAVRDLIRRIRYQTGQRFATLACGDAPNDLDMLVHADRALVFPRATGDYLLPKGANVWHAPKAGPATWLACVSRVFESHLLEVPA